MKVLVVSGSIDKAELISSWLRQMKVEVIHDAICRKAMERIQLDPEIDVVLVVTNPADECGPKLLKNVRMDHRLGGLPIIMAGTDFDDVQVKTYHEMSVTDILVLPTERETLEAKILRAASQSPKKTVLVVDDEPAIREILEQFLIFERYRPLTAGSVDEALGIMERESVDVVVTDINMPVKTGLELLETIKAKWSFVPVVLITGNSGKYSPRDILAMGADGYFAKPFKNTELVYTLRECLKRYEAIARIHSKAVAQ